MGAGKSTIAFRVTRSSRGNRHKLGQWGAEMDMSIPVIVALHLGGNVIFFWGFFKFANQRVFGGESKRAEKEEPDKDIETELKELSREVKRM